MICIRPVLSRVASRILGRSLAASAQQCVEVAPGTRWEVDLPIMLADEPKRIVAHHADSTPSLNLDRLRHRVIEQGPTRMHLLRDAIIADNTVLTPTAYDRIAAGPRRFVLTGGAERLEEGALCSTFVTERYFGHWLKDGVAHEVLAADHGLLPIVLARKPWLHEAGYRAMLQLHPRPVSLAHFDRLWLVEDHELNRDFAARYERLRARVRAALGSAGKPQGRVFIARGKTAVGRGLINEDEVRDALVPRGFTVLEPENSSAEEIARTLASARLAITPEGSASSHVILALPRGSALLTIIGAQHFNMLYKPFCDALGLRFGLTIAEPVDAERFRQPIDRLLRTVDLVEAALG